MTPSGGSPHLAEPRVEIPTRLLVLGMMREDGSIHADEVYRVAEACGMTGQQIRLYLHRLATDGHFDRRGRGRSAVFTPSGRTRAAAFTDASFVTYAYARDEGLAPWDGLWHLVGVQVPEDRRAARDAFRERVRHLGGAAVQSGLYVSPNPWDEYVEAELDELGLVDHAIVLTTSSFRVGTETDPATIAATLWPLQELGTGYRRFLDVVESRLDAVSARPSASDDLVLRAAVEIAIEFDRAIEPDPLLPPEMLPADWPGKAARRALSDAWSQLEEALQGPFPLFRAFARLAADPSA